MKSKQKGQKSEIINIFKMRATKKNLTIFAGQLMELQRQIGFKISSRGWAYQLETERLINKDDFDRVEETINRLRKEGYLPIDFVAEEEGRQFSNVEEPETRSPAKYFFDYLNYPLRCENWYTPDWWTGEKYYIQMVVEKIDLKTLFLPICEKYHLPIATSKGWSSMLQRAGYARRFKQAEDMGLIPVLLYCGDHDPDGLRISDFINSNLEDLRNIRWEDGEEGFDPQNLIIERFGLNYDFIEQHKLTWIDNLITGSKKNLASPQHKNFKLPYVQEYLKTIGARKCEANAIVPIPEAAKTLVEDAIISYLGKDAVQRFDAKKQAIKDEVEKIRTESGFADATTKVIDFMKKNYNIQ